MLTNRFNKRFSMVSTVSQKARFWLGMGVILSGAGWVNAQAAAQPGLQCLHLPMLMEAYLQSHYSIRELNEQLRQRTIEQFIKQTDPSKSLFLESDVVRLKTAVSDVFRTMQKGDCSPLNEAVRLAIQRAQEDEALAKSVLTAGYKLDESVELLSDPDKRGYPKTLEEKKALNIKLLHFQIANYLAASTKLDEAKRLLIHRYELMTKRLKEKAESESINLYAQAFASALDPHSSYMSPDNLEDFQISMRLSLEGIGASLSSQDGFTVIEDLIPGGGAEKSKLLRPKDKIIAVAQEGQKPVSTIDMDLKDVVKMIRGKKNTRVTLTILRQAEKSETFDVSIIRDKIDVKEQAAKITYETRKLADRSFKIGIIDLPSFYGDSREGGRSSFNDMKTLVKDARDKKADGLVLNLSRNGGGLLEDAVRISGLFIKKGGVVATKDTQKNVQVLADEDPEIFFSGPVVILTSRLSASASEILAGALKDYKRAVVVGSDHTFGKGTVQVLSGLGPSGALGAMKVTTGMFFLPGGESTQHKGVAADIQIPSAFGNVDEVGEQALDYSLPPQATTAFLSKEANASDPSRRWGEVTPALVKKLTEKSKARVAKNAKFAEIKKENDEAAKNRGIIRVAELIKKSDKKKTPKDKAERDQKLKDIEAPMIQEGISILSDWLAETNGLVAAK